MTKNPQPNCPAVTETDYKHLSDGTILKQTITKQVFKGLPKEAILKEEAQRNASDVIKKTFNNTSQDEKPKRDYSRLDYIIKSIMSKKPEFKTKYQVILNAVACYNATLQEKER